MPQRVSVICTVLNEGAAIGELLDGLARQTRPPDEVVVVDGGSTDDTLDVLRCAGAEGRIPLRVLSRPGCNIARGRNEAIAAARGETIAVTDAGVRPEADWLAELLAPLEDPAVDVVGGFFLPDGRSTFEEALGAITLPLPEEVDPATFQPSSRSVAFRRRAWEAVGGYPEWLDYCEDLVFDLALRDRGLRFAFAPRAIVHFRPRPSLAAYARQYYRYARGDGKADLFLIRHAIRYGTYLLGLPLLVALSAAHHPLWLLGLGGAVAGLLRTPLRRLTPRLEGAPWRKRLAMLGWAPVIRVTGDVAKMVGYPAGVWWRLHHAPARPWPRRVL